MKLENSSSKWYIFVVVNESPILLRNFRGRRKTESNDLLKKYLWWMAEHDKWNERKTLKMQSVDLITVCFLLQLHAREQKTRDFSKKWSSFLWNTHCFLNGFYEHFGVARQFQTATIKVAVFGVPHIAASTRWDGESEFVIGATLWLLCISFIIVFHSARLDSA